MELQTISAVSKIFDVSTRTLRYYEQIGILNSCHKEGYAYRTYDIDAMLRLEQILILRKLQIPLKQIKSILDREDASETLDIFTNKINRLSNEITALSTIKSILSDFVERLRENHQIKVDLLLLADESIIRTIGSLSKKKIDLRREFIVEDLNKANETLAKLTNVRIIYLPPATVASSQFYCDEPEMHASEAIGEFIRESNLAEIKPDSRHYGFNNPSPTQDTPDGMPDHGYEMWVTIPDDMKVPGPLVKKKFPGGMYAAHMIKFGDFHEWKLLADWVKNNEDYEPVWGDSVCMGGCLEEQLNYLNNFKNTGFKYQNMQMDLLIPIKSKTE